jgi:two-component system CheB/CheR fusion protein
MSAADFIPFSEASGQIRALGVLSVGLLGLGREALATAGHSELAVAINMSATQLEDRAVLAAFAKLPSPVGLHNIVLEVIESVFLPDHRKALEGLRELTGRGARVSVDDFGSGYSNFRLLESLSPDFIKIDRSFLCGSQSTDSRLALIRSMVEMSHALGASVVVEGVETDEQRLLTLAAGADQLQGYYFAKPMPLPELLAWLAARRPPTPL